MTKYIRRNRDGTRQCVVCGRPEGKGADECESSPPLCDSCNAHGPFCCGWPAATADDLKNVAPSFRAAVARELGIRI
jgi:hypothetical protein